MAPIDPQIPGSPGWRLKKLINKLADDRPAYDLLDSYYTGAAACRALNNRNQREAYQRLMHYSRTNFAELVVEAVRERLKVDAFRTGASGDDNGDSEAWGIWQANQLDADSSILNRWFLTMRDAYVIVGPVDSEIDAPLISIEDPRFVTVEYDAARRRKVTAALKMVRDYDAGVDKAYLYLLSGGQAWVLRAERPSVKDTELVRFDGLEWVDQQRLPFPIIPVVGFHNRMSDRSWGEFEPHIALLDRINFGVLNRLEIATMLAFKQRAATGGPTHDPATGEEIDYADIFNADPASIWHLPEGMSLWESQSTDLGPLQQSIKDDVRDLALVTRTPLYYMTADAAGGSAEGASLSREGLVFKTEDRQVEAGEPYEQMMSLAFMYQGDMERANRRDMEIVWHPAERISLSAKADAASKLAPIGLPFRNLMEDVMGYSPQQADRIETNRQADILLAPEPPVAPSAPVESPVAANA